MTPPEPPELPERPAEDAVRLALVDAARSLSGLGLNHGSAGNLSVRWHRGGADGLLITPSALPYDRCTIDDVVCEIVERFRSAEPAH